MYLREERDPYEEEGSGGGQCHAPGASRRCALQIFEHDERMSVSGRRGAFSVGDICNTLTAEEVVQDAGRLMYVPVWGKAGESMEMQNPAGPNSRELKSWEVCARFDN